MKIVADENIALALEAFSAFGDVELYPGRKITNKILKDAEILVIRSITNVNEELLENTKVRFVGTATIGWDHIDTDYLAKKGIRFTSAAGCNSDAVTEYVTTALFDIAVKYNISLKNKKMGIIGVGNIGSRVARIAAASGIEVLMNDPPLREKTGSAVYLPLYELFDCEIITLHVPLNPDGRFKTYHLLNHDNLPLLNENTILINTSRGPVVDNSVLDNLIAKKNLITVLDVWENEPSINKNLLAQTEIATPHIAGYSFEGKINGTLMIYNELCRFLDYDPGWKYVPPDDNFENLTIPQTGTFEQKINSMIKKVYNIRENDADLRKTLNMDDIEIPQYFDELRKNYNLRREFFNYKIIPDSTDIPVINALKAMRFK